MLIVSYQMGKVASSAITSSIKNCIQIHSLNGEEPIKYFSSRYTGSLKGRILQYFKWKYVSKKLNKKIKKATSKNEKIKFIVGVREPVSRNISGYFQTLTPRLSNENIEEHIIGFYSFCPHLAPCYWFDLELKKHFGFNVYSYPFNKEKGFSIINYGEMDYFIYQFEKIGKIENELNKFLEIDDFEIVRENESTKKWSASLYKEFKNNVKFDKNYLNLLYSSRYCKHFYSADDIEKFINKWSS